MGKHLCDTVLLIEEQFCDLLPSFQKYHLHFVNFVRLKSRKTRCIFQQKSPKRCVPRFSFRCRLQIGFLLAPRLPRTPRKFYGHKSCETCEACVAGNAGIFFCFDFAVCEMRFAKSLQSPPSVFAKGIAQVPVPAPAQNTPLLYKRGGCS